jgi:hypothetical protein
MQYQIGKNISVFQTKAELSIKFNRRSIDSIGIFIPTMHILFVLFVVIQGLKNIVRNINSPIFIIFLLSLPIAILMIVSELSLSYEIRMTEYNLCLITTRLNQQYIKKIPVIDIINIQKIYNLTGMATSGAGIRLPKICVFLDSQRHTIPASLWDSEADELVELLSNFLRNLNS